MEMDPATALIRKLGGEAKVAGIAGTALSAPYRWQHEKSRGGTGGLIPQAYHRRLLDYADAHGIALAAEEFLPPRARTCSVAPLFPSALVAASIETRAPDAGIISLNTAMLWVRPPGAGCCVNAAHRKMPLER